MTLTVDGGMKVCPLFDAPLHAAIANELTHTVPPQNPVFSGRPLSYHVGADLPAAMFANIVGLGVADLTLRFIPTLFCVMTMLTVFCFSRLWLASDYAAVLVSFLAAFGEDLSFIPGSLQGSASDCFAYYFRVPAVLLLFSVNPMLPALGFLVAGLYCFLKANRERPLTWQLIAGLLFAALAECKIFTAVHLGISLVLTGTICLLTFRRPQMLQSTIITGIGMLPVLAATFLSNRGEAESAASFLQSHACDDMLQQLGLTTPLASVSRPTSVASAV
jgi:hypothetical protein